MTEKELLKIISDIEKALKELSENDSHFNERLDKIIKDMGE